MPVVFYSPMPGSPVRSVMNFKVGEIQAYRKGMSNLEDIIKNCRIPSASPIYLSGSFPKEEVLAMIAQNKDCTHVSFMVGQIVASEKDFERNYSILIPMTDVKEGDPHSGKIIDNEGTIYTAICCQHPPFIDVLHP